MPLHKGNDIYDPGNYRGLRERPFNLKGGVMVFFQKNILIPNVAEKKYSDFGGGEKKI